MIRAVVIVALVCLLLAPVASGGNGITVRPYSQQYSQSRAGAGARIDLHQQSEGRPARVTQPAARSSVDVSSERVTVRAIGSATGRPLVGPRFPVLPAGSPILKTAQPAGPGSFWYSDGAGHACMYAPNSVLPCFTITGAGTPATAAPLSPASIAAHVADRLSLSPGEIKASPAGAGLTGAASWFWLDPAPRTEQLSLTLAGEAVTVTATPQISWQFGDGAGVDGGAGVPYQSGSIPSDAITHVYDTRCLPGDQGRDPYVLRSCGGNGYRLVATVSWQISFRAEGPVAASGALPTRTTSSSAAYAVSEARAFLVQGASG